MSDQTVGFLYKCRRCGKIECNPHGSKESAAFTLIEVILGLPDSCAGIKVTMLSIHSCIDGGTGVSDLIGYVPDKEES